MATIVDKMEETRINKKREQEEEAMRMTIDEIDATYSPGDEATRMTMMVSSVFQRCMFMNECHPCVSCCRHS